MSTKTNEPAKTFKLGGVKYVIRRFSFGEENEILDNVTCIDERGRTMILTGTKRRLSIKFGVVEPEMTDEMIDNISKNVGRELYSKIQELNSEVPLEI